MQRILTAVVLIPIILLVAFKAPTWLFMAACGVFAVLATYEYLSLARRYEPGIPLWPGLIVVAFLFGGLALANQGITRSWLIGFCLTLAYPFFLLAIGMRSSEARSALFGAGLGSFILPYILLPFLALIFIRQQSNGWFYLLWLFAMVWSGDIFAYYVGKNFGKRLLAPSISPKKTWEGTVASVIGAAAVSVTLVHFSPEISLALGSLRLLSPPDGSFSLAPPVNALGAALIAVVVNVLAQIGDLAESVIKRGAGVKDSGNLLPGHGGILDRIDALLFAAPAALLLFFLIRPFD